ncbi:scavenger receptor cysteine-rich domain-containing protein DMBT1-like [Amphiura filiformis]|uniref:scavenger receptor cysteine-rich domain-containing protein DMBT1-like n=1 Tax=Amphiura filiformis TaxID=82378 RepID=UPI003B218E5F
MYYRLLNEDDQNPGAHICWEGLLTDILNADMIYTIKVEAIIDDILEIVKKESEKQLTEHLNKVDETGNLKFTYEAEESGTMPFLDTLIVRKPDGSVTLLVYRKATHTDQYLNFNSAHPLHQKLGVVRTLLDRKEENKNIEEDHIRKALNTCGYPNWSIDKVKNEKQQPKKKITNKTSENKTRANVTLPYIEGITERVQRILRTHNIASSVKPHTSLRRFLVHPKDKVATDDKTGVIYENPCHNCQKTYVAILIRIVGRSNSNEGRVEILYNNVWGTVCDDSWSPYDARAVCRQLGLPYSGAQAIGGAAFGQGSGQIWLDDVRCGGSERRLSDCDHGGWGVHNCRHAEDAGVRCFDSIRIVGGSNSNEGRVEILHDNVWGTVCDDSWSLFDARAVCRQLGLPYSGTRAITSAAFGQGSGQIWLDEVRCGSSERSLSDCDHGGWGVHNCDHDEDAGVHCFEVCDDSWSPYDARAVCRQLELPYSGARAIGGATFGQGSGQIWLDNVLCGSSERRLSDCDHGGWGVHNCNHAEDAGVRCFEAIRIVGGSNSNEGRVEILHDNVWGTVCDDLWSSFDARAVCRQLGLPYSGARAIGGAAFGQGSGQIWLDNVLCGSSERSLSDCDHGGWGVHNCDHDKDAGVLCKDSIRIVRGSNSNEGRVEILHDNVWGTVCDDSWSLFDARTVCRQLGLPYSDARAIGGAGFGQGSGQIWLDDVRCGSSERSLSDCDHGGWGVHNCDHAEDAGVRCFEAIRIVGGSNSNEGRVEILHDDVWGTVCDDLWSPYDAKAVCRQLGLPYSDARAITSATFGQGSGRIWLDNVRCGSSERSLSDCDHGGWGVHNCNHAEDAGVRCFEAIRIVGGSNSNEGRVEIFHDNVWGTVCDDSWSLFDARAVCRQLGLPYSGARAITSAAFGQGSGQIWLDDVRCGSSERSLSDCDHGGWGVHNCGHAEDAGVRCSY